MAITAAPSASGQSSITVAGTMHFEDETFESLTVFSSSSSIHNPRSFAIVSRQFDTANLVANYNTDKRTMMVPSFSATALWLLRLHQSYTNVVFET